MKLELCKKSLLRLTPDLAPLLSVLREREHTPLVRDCLNRCQRCDLGFVMATADGMPLSVATIDLLVSELDALAADDA